MIAQADPGTAESIVREAIKDNPKLFADEANKLVKRVVHHKLKNNTDAILDVYHEVRK